MRARIARKLLRRLERHTPALLVGVQLQILLNLAARAFHAPGKSVWRRAPGQALREYAEFTVGCMRRGGAEPENLYRSAFDLGKRLRRLTGFTDAEDIERLIFYLYRNLRISMSGHLPGEITVRKCYFSGFYAPEQCALMSAVDSGVMSGLLGGGTLTFTERITEGHKTCAGCFTGGTADER